jgi:hypothetical protein
VQQLTGAGASFPSLPFLCLEPWTISGGHEWAQPVHFGPRSLVSDGREPTTTLQPTRLAPPQVRR